MNAHCHAGGCSLPVHAHGLCSKHAGRLWRGVDIDARSARDKSDTERFWEKVSVTAGDACWLWTGALQGKGYGAFYAKGRRVAAHRFAYTLAYGHIDDENAQRSYHGVCVLHRCDTPSCVNPLHLFLGTNRDNAMDRAAKGRGYQEKKTHCPAGHSYSTENTYINRTGRRECRACHRTRVNNRNQLKRSQRESGGVSF